MKVEKFPEPRHVLQMQVLKIKGRCSKVKSATHISTYSTAYMYTCYSRLILCLHIQAIINYDQFYIGLLFDKLCKVINLLWPVQHSTGYHKPCIQYYTLPLKVGYHKVEAKPMHSIGMRWKMNTFKMDSSCALYTLKQTITCNVHGWL